MQLARIFTSKPPLQSVIGADRLILLTSVTSEILLNANEFLNSFAFSRVEFRKSYYITCVVVCRVSYLPLEN